MIGKPTRILLFLSSYLPLYIGMGVLAAPEFGLYAWSPTAVGILALLGIPLVQLVARRQSTGDLQVNHTENHDRDILAHLLGYFVFVQLDYTDHRQLLVMGGLFFFLGWIQVATNAIHLHPILLLGGRHIIDVETTDGRCTVIAPDSELAPNQLIHVVQLAPRLYWMNSQ